jgi:hypothetical protein
MFLTNFLPDWVFYFILLAGLAGLIISFFIKVIPFVNTYRVPVQLASIVLTVLGVWFAGGIAKDKEYRTEIEAAKKRAEVAEQRAKDATARVEYVFQDKVKIVKETQVIVQEKIRDLSIKIDDQCRVIPEVIDIHNQAARNSSGAKK